MDERTAEQLAVLVGGEAWQSGGGIYIVTVTRDDGSLVVFSGDAVCEYANDEAFEAGTASRTILLSIVEADDLYVIVDLKGTVLYQDNAMEDAPAFVEPRAQPPSHPCHVCCRRKCPALSTSASTAVARAGGPHSALPPSIANSS